MATEEKEVVINGKMPEYVARYLLECRERGERVFCRIQTGFHNGILHSDTVEEDYKKIFGLDLNAELKRLQEYQSPENVKKREEIKRAQEEARTKYKQMILKSRIPGQDVIITMPIVIDGLKFIAENPKLEQEKLIEGLIKLGCNFTIDDIEKQFTTKEKFDFKAFGEGNIYEGALVIAAAMRSEDGRSYCYEQFQSVDREISIYQFIRSATGDQSYTMDNLFGRKK